MLSPARHAKFLKKIGLAVGTVVMLALSVIVVRAMTFASQQLAVDPIEPIDLDEDALAGRLAAAVRHATVSYEDAAQFDRSAFLGLHATIEQSFPKLHAVLRRETIHELSLLYTWTGKDTSQPPLLLMGHLDVVPIETGTESEWQHPPFGGVVADGFVWGRGTLDDKASVLAILEAVERLVADGFQPDRTVLLAFGHDEEVGGHAGAEAIAERLRQRGIEPWMVLDEGLVITHDMMPGLDAPLAVIGIAEKGYLSVELTVAGKGGHSSMPPPQTAIGVLSAAITRLEEHPMQPSLDGVVGQMFDAVGPEMGFVMRLVFANRWLFASIVESQLDSKPSTAALIRTTSAVTMIDGGVKDNVLPTSARAVVNFRIRPGESQADVLAHVRAVVADERVQVTEAAGAWSEPSPVSSTEDAAWTTLATTVREVFPEAVVSPGLMVGASDSRHYGALAADVYRFVPMVLGPDDLPRIHGANERIAVSDYANIVRFYVRLVQNGAGGSR